MRTYFEAYTTDGRQILGNLDGQGVTKAFNYRRTAKYRELLMAHNRPKWSNVAYWRVVTEGGALLETIPNLFREAP
jgi:hypothetical protein